MSKYVIELRPDCKVVQQICESNGQVSIGAKSIECLEKLNSDYINEHFGSLQDDAYKRGLEDGKAVNDKGCEGCLLQGTGSNICDQCCNSYANQWMARDGKITVGDEVINILTKTKGILLEPETKDLLATVIIPSQRWRTFNVRHANLKKTGRHFDIKGILEAMKHD